MSVAPDVFQETKRKARRRWRCCECYEHIEPGEEYWDHSGLWDGRWDHFRLCMGCKAWQTQALTALKIPYEDLSFGRLFETISDYDWDFIPRNFMRVALGQEARID